MRFYSPPTAEHIYRNPRTEVQRLLDKYHKEHYKVYNFANEAGRTYPDQLFQGRVERYVPRCRGAMVIVREDRVQQSQDTRSAAWMSQAGRIAGYNIAEVAPNANSKQHNPCRGAMGRVPRRAAQERAWKSPLSRL